MTPKHLLLVEDSDLVATALGILFQEHGYRVSIAPTVAAAVDRAAAEVVDVMLLDLTLPDGHGLNVLTQLRERQHQLPHGTIALTGHDDDATQERCLAAGCHRLLVKPVPTQELVAAVQALEADRP